MTTIKEVWKMIKGQTHHEVSSYGKVRSLTRKIICKDGRLKIIKGKVLKPATSRGGYFHISTKRNGKFRCTNIHRLVAEAFIPNPFRLPQVNHKDGIKTNNNRRNLEWKTHRGNMRHASKMGLAKGGSLPGSLHPESKLIEDDVLQIRSDKIHSNVELAKFFGVSNVMIGLIKNRRNWRHI